MTPRLRLIAVVIAFATTTLSCRIAPRYAASLDGARPLDAALPETTRDSKPADMTAQPATAVPLGVYHLTGAVDGVNLSLNPDSSFHWTVCGCDWAMTDVGIWYEQDGANYLWPLPGQFRPLTWFLQWGTADVRHVVLKPTEQPDKLEAIANGDSSTETQYWYRGRRCVECGAVGPKGDAPCKSEALPITAVLAMTPMIRICRPWRSTRMRLERDPEHRGGIRCLLALSCVVLSGCCDSSDRCERRPESPYMDYPVWPDVRGLQPRPGSFSARVALVDQTQFVLELAPGDSFSVAWHTKSAPPPFKVDQRVNVTQCAGAGLNGRSAATVRAEDGSLLYAAASGFEFMPFPCLPPEVVYRHEDHDCCGNSALAGCGGDGRNTALHFSGTSETTVWTGEEGELTVLGRPFVVHNLYSFTNDWGRHCTDNADLVAAFAVSRKAP